MFPKNPFNSPDDLVKAVTEIMTGKAKKEALDPVDAKALKGSHADRKDKDIDNDGDVDSSDKYLHNRRKAVKKAMNEAKVKENEDEDDMEDDDDEKTDAQKNDLDGDGKNDKKKKKKKDDELSGKPDKINTKPTLDDTRTMMAKEEVDLKEQFERARTKIEGEHKTRHGTLVVSWLGWNNPRDVEPKAVRRAFSGPEREDATMKYSKYTMQLKFKDGKTVRIESGNAAHVNKVIKALAKAKSLPPSLPSLTRLKDLKDLKEEVELDEEPKTLKLAQDSAVKNAVSKIHSLMKVRKISPSQAYSEWEKGTTFGLKLKAQVRAQVRDSLSSLHEMSDVQMKKREEIVKGMKDKTADFKKRYGDRWKDVMYATATKQAMKEEMDEARGRPKKEDDVSSDSNFVMQLRKAISLNGNKVNFLDGSSSQVSSRDAQQFMTVYNKQKSSIDKGRLMKSAHKSLKHFKMALQGKIEKPKNPLDLD